MQHLIPSLATLVLASFVANLIHWRARGGEHWLYVPQAGLLRAIFVAWTVAVVITAVLFLAQVISAPEFMVVALGMTIAQMTYSIAHRQPE